MSAHASFTCGPFYVAKKEFQGLAANMYYFSCLDIAIKELNKIEEEYKILRTSGLDPAAAAEKRDALEVHESIIICASELVDSYAGDSRD